jgi:UDP-2-acetamido-3-amino-2,3-dideoxy-glucuronate N-acetyltransferase
MKNEMVDEVFVHPLGLCESNQIGVRTKIWAFAHVLPEARIGSDCNICNNVFVENRAIIGDRVTIKCGVQIWDGVTLEDDVFVGPNATFSNDTFPRSRQRPAEFVKTVVRKGASIGANATVLPGVSIGERAMIGAGSVVTRDVPPRAIVVGNPGRIVGYTGTVARQSDGVQRTARRSVPAEGRLVGGCSFWQFPKFGDLRGDLTVAELSDKLPFVPKRVFFVYNVPSDHVRGEHAHRECTQLLLAIKGIVSIVIDDGQNAEEIALEDPSIGLLVPPKIWTTQYRFSSDAVLVVFASHSYQPDDYVREYSEFERLVKGRIGDPV